MIGIGWEEILESAFEDLHSLGVDLNTLKVKEKFGSLVIQFLTPPKELDKDAAYAIIRRAEERSLRVCEACGAPGKQVTLDGLWLKTACEKHSTLNKFRSTVADR